ncbi:MAG: hypothetical protein ACRC42_03080 [Mycoplasma sp.]
MIENLFKRPNINTTTYSENYKLWIISLNLTTLGTWSRKKTFNLHDNKDYEDFLLFRFSILDQWVQSQDIESEIFIERINKFIKTLCLENQLNATEKNFIHELKAKKFTNSRNLKSLIIDFDPLNEEVIYFHYRKIKMILPSREIKSDIDFYISNKRIIITYLNEVISFNLLKIEQFNFTRNEFNFTYYGLKYNFELNSSEVIKQSFKRIFKEIKAEFNYVEFK